jgi:protein O-mannosyl-transferase
LRRSLIYALLLAGVCLIVFAPAYKAGITNWDDEYYLRAPQSQRITTHTFTDFVFGSFHPLTIFSFAIEQQFVGRSPSLLHTTNVLLHAGTAILVFLLLQELTAMPFGAFAGALLWAVHPLRVESVVWIAARKDVLSGIFFVAALLAYVRRRLPFAFVFFVLSLLAKGTAVTFPLAILAIDYLQRRKAIAEKIPFFALSLIFGIVAYVGQRSPGAAPKLPGFAFSPLEKIVLSCQTLLFYLGKVILPVGLSSFYPYPPKLTVTDWLAPLFLLVIVILIALTTRVTRAIAFAFAFFVVTIAIILPLVSLGFNVAADRFTYIPSIGIAYAVALIAKEKWWPAVALVAAMLGALAFNRSRVWHDSVTLWSNVIDNDPGISRAWNSRGVAFVEEGDFASAVRDFDRSIALEPCYEQALVNRYIVAEKFGDKAGAAAARDKLTKCRK